MKNLFGIFIICTISYSLAENHIVDAWYIGWGLGVLGSVLFQPFEGIISK